jgi:hypothetical protein
MSADNLYVILKEEDGTYTVRMEFMSGLENFGYYEKHPEEAEKDGWTYKTPEEMVRNGRVFYRSTSLQDAYEWAVEQSNSYEGYTEYGVEIWCPSITMDEGEFNQIIEILKYYANNDYESNTGDEVRNVLDKFGIERV